MRFTSDTELFAAARAQLYAAVVSDALDDVGRREQVMHAQIRPLSPDFVVVGRAMPILAADVFARPQDPYKLEIESVDSLKPGDVVVAKTSGADRTGLWGELLSTAAVARGALGAVVDGCVRDVRRIQRLGFPVFATGIRPVDSMGRSLVIDYNCPVECCGVLVEPGDVVFGDLDGVVVVPKAVEAEVFERAFAKAERESHSRAALLQKGYLRDVYDRFGVL